MTEVPIPPSMGENSGSYNYGLNGGNINNTWTGGQNTGGTIYLTPQQAMSQGEGFKYFANLNVNSRKDWDRYTGILKSIGYITPGMDMISQNNLLISLGNSAVEWAANNYSSGKSVFDYFNLLPPNPLGPDGTGINKTVTNSRTVDQSSRTDSAAVLNNAYQSMLGRMASEKEIGAFQKALNDLQQKNPNLSTNVNVSKVTDGTNNVSSSTNSRGGFNASQFGVDWAMSRPEYAENFAATTFMNTIGQMINSGPSLEGKVMNG